MLADDFDFQEWAQLAEKNSAAFESMRRQTVDSFIAQAPSRVQERLTRLQWRIDAERRRHRHPLGSCLAIYRMMMDSLYAKDGLQAALIDLVHLHDSPHTQSQTTERHSCPVIPLAQRGKHLK